MILNDAEKLQIYDVLRTAHHIVEEINLEVLETQDQNAVEAVLCVMYLAEGHFARMSD